MVSTLALSTLVLSAVMLARADGPVPSTPGPSQSYNQGADCPIAWSADTTGLWKNMAIQLMTGDNWNMVPITTVTELDATTTTTFTWPCPAVTLNAPVYFYQFSAQGQNLTWTTRFTIASSSGQSVPAPNTTQPDGTQVGWGVGALQDPSTAKAPPTWLASSTASGSAAAASASAPPASVASAAASSSAPASSASAAVSTPSAASSPSAAASVSHSPIASASNTAAKSSASSVVSNTTSNGSSASGTLGRADMIAVLTRSVTALCAVGAVFAFTL